jgi:hypothetical protein
MHSNLLTQLFDSKILVYYSPPQYTKHRRKALIMCTYTSTYYQVSIVLRWYTVRTSKVKVMLYYDNDSIEWVPYAPELRVRL